MARRPCACRRPPLGASAILVVVVLALICAFLALALNVGHLMSVRGELQNAVDSGALAGAKDLTGTPEGLDPALASGKDYAGRHDTDSHIQVVADQLELGHWTHDADCSAWGGVETGRTGPGGYRFCRIDARDAPAAREITAVRVQAQRAQSTTAGGGGVPLFLHAFLGHGPTSDVGAEAVAVSGGPCTSCPNAPLAIRSDCLEDGGGSLRCGQLYTLGLSSATIDSAGFTTLSADKVNCPNICTVLENGKNGPACPVRVRVGDQIQTGNGNFLSAGCCKDGTLKTLCDWFALMAGQEITLPVVEYPGDTKGCLSGGYQGAATVVGSARFLVTEVYCKGNAPPTSPCAGYATGQCIVTRYDCDGQDDGTGPIGCGWWGISPLRPQLVR